MEYTPKELADMLRNAERVYPSGEVRYPNGVVIVAHLTAEAIADALDPPDDKPPREPRDAIHTRPKARKETR